MITSAEHAMPGRFLARHRPRGLCENQPMDHALSVETLEGRHVRLEQLSSLHAADLATAARDDRSTYRYTPVPDGIDEATAYVEGLVADREADRCVPFAQVDVTSGRALGATRFMTIRRAPGQTAPFAVEIGGTWLGASAQRTGVNTEAKLLMMSYAFDRWGVARLDLKTDARNDRSRTAILRLGATFEGVLRQWQPSLVAGEDALYRDTAMYSVVRSEWPEVRAVLEARLR